MEHACNTYATNSAVLARVRDAFVIIVQFASGARNASRTRAKESKLIGPARAAVLARARVTFGVGIAILAGEAGRASAGVARLRAGAHAAIVTRRVLAEVDLKLAVAAHEAGLAVAPIVVDQLDAVQRSSGRARVRQTFVDVAFTAWPDKTRRTLALEPADLVHTDRKSVV